MATGKGSSRMSRVLRRVSCGLVGVLALSAGPGLSSAAQPVAAEGPAERPASHAGAIRPQELVEMRGLSGLAVSPDGAYVAVRIDQQDVAADTTHLGWHVIRLSDGHDQRVADAGGPRWNVNGYLDFEAPQWSSDGRWIYFRKVEDQQAQVWRVSREGGRAEQVTHDAADIEGFILNPDTSLDYAARGATRAEILAAEAFEHDNGVHLDKSLIKGFAIARSFPVNGRMASYRRLLPADMNTGRTTLLGDRPLRMIELPSHGRSPTPAPKAAAARMQKLWSASFGGAAPFDPKASERWVSTSSGRRARIGAPAPDEVKDLPASRSGSFLFWRGSEPGAIEIACGDLVCTEADALDAVGWTASGDELVFETLTFGATALHAWNVGTGRIRTLTQGERYLGAQASGAEGVCRLARPVSFRKGDVSVTAAREEAICIAAAADMPPRLVAIDLASGAERVLLDPDPSFTPDRLGVAEKITLEDRYGDTTYGRLILPANRRGKDRLPLVITSYGCSGFLLGGSGRDEPEHVFAGRGYAAICIDLGGDTVRHGPQFSWSADIVEKSAFDFFNDAVDKLDKQGLIDRDRVALTGFSGSATDTTYVLTWSHAFAAAVVTTEGSQDAIGCYLVSVAGNCQRVSKQDGYRVAYDSRTGLLANSPAWNAERITTPLLVQISDAEYVSMLQLFSAMRDLGRAIDMYVFPDAFHYKHDPRQRLAVYDRNLAWMDFWLRGIETATPSRAKEIERWRLMKARQCDLFSGEVVHARPPWYCRAKAD
ncbi:MAG: Atxe2 family lasso peptide isopeptidase [Alphaproteobacteria bacterium]|nr:Atxe2 family lasso peptide isopeptidase [Alphaproteobacteria bacterium]